MATGDRLDSGFFDGRRHFGSMTLQISLFSGREPVPRWDNCLMREEGERLPRSLTRQK